MLRVLLVAIAVLLATNTTAHAWLAAPMMMSSGSARGLAPPTNSISAINPSSTTFTAQAGNAGAALGTFSVGVSGGTFGGTFALSTGAGCTSSADNVLFTVASNGVYAIGGSDIVTPRAYQICVAAADPAFSNSPYRQTVTLTGSAAGASSVSVSNYSPAARSTVTVTYNPGTASSSSAVLMLLKSNSYNVCSGDTVVAETPSAPSGYMTVPSGAGSVSFTIPNVASVEPQTYIMAYAPAGAFNCSGAAYSSTITVPGTLPAYNYPGTGIPANTTAYPSAAIGVSNWPNPPSRVLTVCPAGPPTCQYSTLSAAVYDAGFTNPVDYTQIKVDCGTYNYNNQSGDWRSDGTLKHLWIYGHCATGALPHFVQDPASNPPVNGYFQFIDQSYYIYELIVDNIEVSGWQHGGASAPALSLAACNGDANQWTTMLRNVYLHDMGQGIFKGVGDCAWNFTMLNSHLARTGGTTGPAHGIYISNVVKSGNPYPVSITFNNSVFEENYYGHLVKSHATTNVFNCDVFIKDYSEVYAGAKEIETEQGGYVETITNSLFVHGPFWWDNTQSNLFGMGYAAEWTGGYVALPSMYMSMSNSIYLNDDTGTQAVNNGTAGVPVGQYAPFDSGHVPTAWNNNTFVGPYGSWGASGTVPMTAPFVNWCWDGGQQANCLGAGYVNGNTQVDLGCGSPPNPGGSPPGNVDYACAQDQSANSKGNLFYSTRATAASANWPSSAHPLGALPNADGGAIEGWSALSPTIFPLPTACTQAIGNVAPPAS